jgi:hypothetical protein
MITVENYNPRKTQRFRSKEHCFKETKPKMTEEQFLSKTTEQKSLNQYSSTILPNEVEQFIP